MKRLFIEIDKIDKDSLETLSELGKHMHKLKSKKSLFDTVIGEAAFKTGKVYEAIKKHDQLFASSSLIPRYGYGSSFGSGSLMNALMHKAIKENMEGKSLYFFNHYENIWWDQLEKDLVDKCFRKNFLYTRDEDYENWIQVDIDKLLKEKYDK